MFADWVAARRAAGLDVTVLAGNHDLPYRPPSLVRGALVQT